MFICLPALHRHVAALTFIPAMGKALADSNVAFPVRLTVGREPLALAIGVRISDRKPLAVLAARA